MQTKTLIRKLQRRIDKVLRSTARQVVGLTCFTVAVFFILWAGALLFSRLHVTEWIFAFLNPGSTFTSDATGAEKIWALLVGLAGMILLGGLLISIFNNILQSRIDRVRNGQVHYVFSNHVLIIGYDRMAISLVRQVAGNAAKYGNCEIVLQTVRKVPDVHHELFSNIPARIEKRITILSGNRNSAEDLEKLQPESCREIILLGESDEYDHDSLNIKCLEVIAGILKARGRATPVRCHVLFEYQSTYAVFQQQDLLDIRAHVDFVPFNFYESWAQKVLVDGRFVIPGRERGERDIVYPWLDREPVTAESPKHVHLVILGMSRMGIAMGIQAAHLCHFPNFATQGIRTCITFIDDNAEREMNFLQGRFRHLFSEVDYTYRDMKTGETRGNPVAKKKFTDIRFEFVNGRVEHPDVQQMLAEWADRDRNPDKLLTVAVCFNSSPAAIAAGLYLPEEVYTNEIPVFIRQETSYCTLSLLSQAGGDGYRKYRHVKPFGMLDHAYDLDRANDLLPMMVKYVYDKTTSNAGMTVDEFDPKIIRENWEDWTKNKETGEQYRNITALKLSNIYNANMSEIKQRSLNIRPGKELSDEQVNLLARVEHNRWNIEKLLMGYRACTPEEEENIRNKVRSKDSYKDCFVHRDIKPYQALSKDDKGIQAGTYDVNISRALPFMLSEYEKFKNSQSTNNRQNENI
ncbi:MAG: hypothetical protein LBL33_01410 [Tannerella sp.]|jgi:hypothetical protein|nr:hypothetical protein [Tannerella sp.]